MAKKKKPLSPRRLRMNRASRLSSARHWLATQKGRTPAQVAKSYRKHYGLDWPCAIQELGLLGIKLCDRWVAELQQSLEGNLRARAHLKAAREESRDRPHDADSDERYSY
ncbi:MAG: hypothetical protein H0X66_22435 [Verrucomicrobia bacterium]|nr:hypothetical protein [Verrucomicrobiota bacterium]